MIPLQEFEFEGRMLPVSFVSTLDVTEGVQCDVYKFVGDKAKDLGIIRIQPGRQTPLQKVLKGDKTIEGYISGKGRLVITLPGGEKKIYEVWTGMKNPPLIIVGINELMQWEADKNSELIAYEICYPPYEDGRYENIS